MAATLEYVLIRFFYDGVVPERQGSSRQNDSFCLLPCKDGHILLTVDRDWDVLINWLDSEGMAGDLKEERWQESAYRRQRFDYIVDILTRWTRIHTRDELFELGQLMHLPWAPVCTLEEMVNSVQLSARNFFVSVEHPEHGAHFPYPGFPCKFSRPLRNARRAPLIGEHNAHVYQGKVWLGSQGRKEDPAIKGQKALEGLRVLDFTRILAGPYATRILADFGSEVIKVQSQKTASGAESNNTGYFNTWNRNKLGITLDMSHPEARDIALRLVKASDVVIENFTPRVMSNWGLGYQSLKQVKPDIIMLSMSGMGQTGPWRDFSAFGATIQASLTFLPFPKGLRWA